MIFYTIPGTHVPGYLIGIPKGMPFADVYFSLNITAATFYDV